MLAKPADVVIEIYDVRGKLIRRLELGHKDAGMYITKDKAAYWDGKNEKGERVTSGIYFYTMKAGDFMSTRKMVILR